MIFKSLKQVKRIIVGVIGASILIVGIAMIVLPGPAFIVIPLGLSILATEFLWAKKIIDKFKEKFEELKKKKDKSQPK
ncbi:hypothetical protein C0389_00385 [bacterium]|nr:hypothetical protein [bacterium]